MPKQNSRSRRSTSEPPPRIPILHWHRVAAEDYWLYARAFHAAAKRLAASHQPDNTPFTDFSACPVVFMYRQAVEVSLKALVLGEGGNFLPTRPDEISVSKTHSVSWLAQFVCQIVTALGWESEFRCDGVESLADFRAIMEDINPGETGAYGFRYPVGGEGAGAGVFDVRTFAARMDTLLDLVASTADALAAEWDLRKGGLEDEGGGGVRRTIQ